MDRRENGIVLVFEVSTSPATRRIGWIEGQLGKEPLAGSIARCNLPQLRNVCSTRWRVIIYPVRGPRSPAGAAAIGAELFCRCNLFDRRSFDFGLLALFIGFIQEPIDDARTLLLLDPSVLRFLLFSEKFVVYFPTHWILHL